MSLSTIQTWANVLIFMGGGIVIFATLLNYLVSQKIDKNKLEETNKRLREERENDKLILALSHDPVIKLSLIDNNRINQFEFNLTNTGTSVDELTKIYEMYYYKGESVGGSGETPPFTYSKSKTNIIELMANTIFL